MLNLDFKEELTQLSSSLVGEIISRMISNGQRVTGKTIDSIEPEVRPTGFTIWSADYIMTLDTGRGPTQNGNGGGQTLQRIILQWIFAKGIEPEGNKNGEVKYYHYIGLAYVIARRIHQEGNLIHRLNKPTGVVTSVITDTRIDAFIGTFGPKFLSYVQTEILEGFPAAA